MTEKSYKNIHFLTSQDARSIRILCEYEEPKSRLDSNKVNDTIVFFGSARAVSSSKALENLEKAKKSSLPQDEKDLEIKKASRALKLSEYYDATVSLSEKLVNWSQKENLGYHVVTGGGPGLMEAANKGAFAASKDKSIGLGISLPFESSLNEYITEDLDFEFHYFFTRKYWFLYYCKAMVVCPGGFGTMDELFETLTLRQTGKIKKDIPTVLLGKKFWDSFMNIDSLVEYGVISESDKDLFLVTDSIDEAFNFLTKEIKKNNEKIEQQ